VLRHGRYLDPKEIRDKIAVKRRQLAELEAENTALLETEKRQERAIHQISPRKYGEIEAAA
jgi:hypothetical protein